MPISALPDAPSPSDTPSQFSTKAFSFLAALSTFRTEANAVETAVDADASTASAAASTATTQAGIATTKAGEALASANSAAQSALDATGAATSAINAFDQFDDRYLGAKGSDPSTDNDGNALVVGALYYRTGDGMRVWNGSIWQAAYIPTTGMLSTSDIGTTVQAYDADLTAWAGKTAPTGAAVGTTDAQTLTNKTISGGVFSGVVDQTGSVRGGLVTVAALDIDCSSGNFFTKTINGNSTFTVSNVPASRAYAFTLELTHTSGTVTWFSGVQWPGGTAPTLTTGKVHLFTFVTDDGGTTWRGASQVNYNS